MRSEQKDDPDELRIQEEIKLYGDILRLDMVDTYADLSMKTLKMFSVLPAKFDADFYFKIDDDVAVNIDAMANYLQAKRNQGNLYLVRRLSGLCWLLMHMGDLHLERPAAYIKRAESKLLSQIQSIAFCSIFSRFKMTTSAAKSWCEYAMLCHSRA